MHEIDCQLRAAAEAVICSSSAHAEDFEDLLHPDEAEKAGLITVRSPKTVQDWYEWLIACLLAGCLMGWASDASSQQCLRSWQQVG